MCGAVMRTRQRKCSILIEFSGQVIRSSLIASDADRPAEISLKVRDEGWKPYKVRFDESKPAWIVSSLEYR
jgi:hypothetical protein